MGPFDFANHLLNFVAPAVFVGFFLALTAPVVLGVRPRARPTRAMPRARRLPCPPQRSLQAATDGSGWLARS